MRSRPITIRIEGMQPGDLSGTTARIVIEQIKGYIDNPIPPTTEESPDFKHDILVLRFLWASVLIAALSFVSGYFWKGLF